MSSGILNRFLAISTVYHILAITFETYYAILRPMEHRVKVEKKKIIGIVLVIWFGSLIIAVVPLTWAVGVLTDISQRPTKEFYRKMSIYETFVVFFGFLLPLTLMVSAHACMFAKIINALKLIRRQTVARDKANVNKNNYKTALLFAVLLLVFTACWLFWFVLGLLKALSDVKHPLPLWAIDTLTITRYSTSFVNPLLYTFFRPDFYTAFKASFLSRNKRVPSITVTYLLNSYHRAKRDSQTTTTFVRESSTSPMPCVRATQCRLSKFVEEDTEV